MMRTRLVYILLFASLWIAAGCAPARAEPTAPPATQAPAPVADLPNPASVHCQETGHTLEIRTDKDGGQYGVCILADGTECDEWAFYRGECGPNVSTATAEPTATPLPPTPTQVPATATSIPPTPTPELAAACAPITAESGPEFVLWHEYTNETYGFTLLVPPAWAVQEIVEPPHTMRDHAILLWSAEEPTARFMVGFKRLDEDQLITRTGVGSGDIVEAGTACFLGQEMPRKVLVFQGKDMTVLYGSGGEIHRDDLAFTLYLDYSGGWEDKTALSKQIQAVADQIVATFQRTHTGAL